MKTYHNKKVFTIFILISLIISSCSKDFLDETAYTEITESTNNPSDEDKTVFRQYEYLPGGIGGRLNAFTKFQVKIVMVGTNTAKSPSIKDLRIIALVT